MLINSFEYLLCQALKPEKIKKVEDQKKTETLYKKNFILKRVSLGSKTSRASSSKDKHDEQILPVYNIFNENFLKYCQFHKKVISDIDQNLKTFDLGTMITHRHTTKQAYINQKTKQQMSSNLSAQKSHTFYRRVYNTNFDAKIKQKVSSNNKDLIFKTSNTCQTIQKTDNPKTQRPLATTSFVKMSQQYNHREFGYTQVSQTEIQQIEHYKKRSSYSFRNQYPKNTFCGDRNRLSLQAKTINEEIRYTKRNNVFTSKDKSDIQKFKEKVLLRSSIFPLQAIRCHSLRKTLNSILFLQQL